MQIKIISLTLTLVVTSFFLNSCKKTIETTPTTTNSCNNCDVKGIYIGTGTASSGATTPLVYRLQEDNLALGSVTLSSPLVSFGGYRNTCDSVILSVFFTSTNHYYKLQGKLSSDSKTISGTFRNLTNTTDFGTFSISK